MSESAPTVREAVTVVFTWKVRPGREADFEQWAHAMEADAAAFTGHQGVTWLRPEGESGRYHAVVRFADTAAPDRWMTSPQRAASQERATGFGRPSRT